MGMKTYSKASPATFDDNCGKEEVEIYCKVAAFNLEGPGKGTYKMTVDSFAHDDVI